MSAAASPSAPTEAKVPFDIERARAILKPESVYQNPSYPYCQFVLENHDNHTKLLVGVSQTPYETTLELDLVTADCPRLHSGQDKPHQHLANLGVHDITGIECSPDYIEFQYGEHIGRQSFVRIFARGYFCGGFYSP